MNEQEALELIDTHLDDDCLTDQQAEELTGWLRENPQHAQRAFQRIFLHTFLRRRLNAQRLPLNSDGTEIVSSNSIDIEPPTDLITAPSTVVVVPPRGNSLPRRLLLAAGIFIIAAAITWSSMNSSSVTPIAIADAYEGFAYPATSIPAPAANAETWPKVGGLQGLAGGAGWQNHGKNPDPRSR